MGQYLHIHIHTTPNTYTTRTTYPPLHHAATITKKDLICCDSATAQTRTQLPKEDLYLERVNVANQIGSSTRTNGGKRFFDCLNNAFSSHASPNTRNTLHNNTHNKEKKEKFGSNLHGRYIRMVQAHSELLLVVKIHLILSWP